jgi:hypothetical protein
VILKHHKLATLYPVEHSMTPHDVWDRWIELYGRGLDAFFPVADTEIGRLAVLMANEGSYPENARGLAMNGAEVVYRASYPHPHTGNEFFEIQNRARALDNNFYVVAPNLATYYLEQDSDLPIDTFGGRYPCRVSHAGDRAADRADGRTRHLAPARAGPRRGCRKGKRKDESGRARCCSSRMDIHPGKNRWSRGLPGQQRRLLDWSGPAHPSGFPTGDARHRSERPTSRRTTYSECHC